MTPWVLVDLSYLAHRARYATASLEWEDFNTGILFGFWEQLRTICQDPLIHSTKVVLFFDSRQSFRRRIFPEYKAHRKDDLTPEEREQLGAMYDQIRLLRHEILPAIGFNIHHQTGCESDDLMAMAALQLWVKSEPGIMVTADGDLYQAINSSVSWYDPARRKFLDTKGFFELKGIPPNKWRIVKQLAGCSGDEVPGIKGVGETTAIRYIQGKLPTHHKTHASIISEEGQQIVARNNTLVGLPHPKTKPINLQPPQYRSEVFFHYAERYGFRSYLTGDRRKEWEAFFQGSKLKTRKRGEA